MTIYKKINDNISSLKDENVVKKISFSQFSTYYSCNYKFYLKYVLGNYKNDVNINLLFGTSVHEGVQRYVEILKDDNQDVKLFNHEDFLYERFTENYKKSLEQNNFKEFTTEQELFEFYEDGLKIMKDVIRDNEILFPSNFIHLGSEIELIKKLNQTYNIHFQAFIDDTFYNKELDRIVIYDYKTSKSGWNNSNKEDEVKLAQLRLYKHFIAEIFGIDLKQIEIKFIILKRKVFENGKKFNNFKPKHYEVFVPASGIKKVQEGYNMINDFVERMFNEDGTHKEVEVSANPSKFNCGFCPFKNDECDHSIS